MIGHTRTILPQRQALIEAARGCTRILEIGTFDGATAAFIADFLPNVEVVSLDIFVQGSISNWFANRKPNQRLFVGTSQQLALMAPEAFDLVFVDGDHRYLGCSADLMASLVLLRPGGRLFAHDYIEKWPGVVQAVDEFCTKTGRRAVQVHAELVEIVA